MVQDINQQAAAAGTIEPITVTSDAKPDLSALSSEEKTDEARHNKTLRRIYEQFPDHFMQLCLLS